MRLDAVGAEQGRRLRAAQRAGGPGVGEKGVSRSRRGRGGW